jgi:hypothetical protein
VVQSTLTAAEEEEEKPFFFLFFFYFLYEKVVGPQERRAGQQRRAGSKWQCHIGQQQFNRICVRTRKKEKKKSQNKKKAIPSSLTTKWIRFFFFFFFFFFFLFSFSFGDSPARSPPKASATVRPSTSATTNPTPRQLDRRSVSGVISVGKKNVLSPQRQISIFIMLSLARTSSGRELPPVPSETELGQKSANFNLRAFLLVTTTFLFDFFY